MKPSDLTKFDSKNYFSSDIDRRTKDNLAIVELHKKGVDLVAQYYSYKYQIEDFNVITSVNQLFEKIKSEDFSKKRDTQGDIRIPLMLYGTHSTPIAYIKEGSKEAILIFDSMENSLAISIAESTQFEVYTTEFSEATRPASKIRQGDTYSCHTDALVFLRELTGKDAQGKFLIPNFFAKLEEEKRVTKNNTQKNLYEIKLFDRLLITTQNIPFIAQQIKNHEVIHIHKDQAEDIDMFLKRYPADEVKVRPPDQKPISKFASSYLREKGLKLSPIIEIQSYLNELKICLGNNFTKKLRNNFIADAKFEFSTHGKIGFFTEGNEKSLHMLAQKYLENNLSLTDNNSNSSEIKSTNETMFTPMQ